MRDEIVTEVAMDATGRLLLKPAETQFDDLHMAGAWGFRWDAPTRSLAVPAPREWSYRHWFEHVVGIIRQEYGVHLKLGQETAWVSVPPSVQQELQASTV